MMDRRLAVWIGAWLVVACAEPMQPAIGQREEALVQPNGASLNGRTLNGRTLNGRTLNGRRLNGRRLNGRTLNGRTLNGIHLVGGSIWATTDRGVLLGGLDLEGVELTGELDDGTEVVLTIEDVTRHPNLSNAFLYTISFVPAGTEELDYACGLASDLTTPIAALPLAGAWDMSEGTPTGGDHVDDADLITLACEDAALAKCADMGYAPWRSVVERASRNFVHQVSLAPLHQACTRMMRADYCGDGMPHTHDTVEIDAWDNFDVQVRARGRRWSFEAEWSAQGARCFSRERLAGHEAADYVDAFCPDQWEGWDRNDSCGRSPTDFTTHGGFDVPLDIRSLLMNETSQPAGSD